MIMNIFKVFFLIALFPQITCGQVRFFGSDTVSITYSDNETLKKYPEELTVYGKIVDVTNGFSCGVMSGSGTMKIKVLKSSKHYQSKYLFLVVPCFSGCDNCIGKKVELNVSALYEKRENVLTDNYPYEPIMNKFFSKGVPFYWVKDKKQKAFW